MCFTNNILQYIISVQYITTKTRSTQEIVQTTTTSIHITELSTTSTLTTFSSISQNDICQDSNPCKSKKNTICQIRKGKAMCECMVGYAKINRTTCEGVPIYEINFVFHCAFFMSKFVNCDSNFKSYFRNNAF